MNIFDIKKLNTEELADLKKREEFPFCFADNQIFFVEEKENKEAELKGVCSYFSIQKVIFDRETGTVKYRLVIETKLGQKEVTVDKGIFLGKKIVSLLR